jgi:hypothetical protein
MDQYPRVEQALADRVDVVDAIGEVAEVAPARERLGVPVVGELDLRVRVAGAARNTSV